MFASGHHGHEGHNNNGFLIISWNCSFMGKNYWTAYIKNGA